MMHLQRRMEGGGGQHGLSTPLLLMSPPPPPAPPPLAVTVAAIAIAAFHSSACRGSFYAQTVDGFFIHQAILPCNARTSGISNKPCVGLGSSSEVKCMCGSGMHKTYFTQSTGHQPAAKGKARETVSTPVLWCLKCRNLATTSPVNGQTEVRRMDFSWACVHCEGIMYRLIIYDGMGAMILPPVVLPAVQVSVVPRGAWTNRHQGVRPVPFHRTDRQEVVRGMRRNCAEVEEDVRARAPARRHAA